MKTELTFSTLDVGLLKALRRMLRMSPDRRPFVIVERSTHGPFVQFATTDKNELLIDCPMLKAFALRCSLDEACQQARGYLSRQGVTEEDTLTLVEHAEKDDDDGEFVWALS